MDKKYKQRIYAHLSHYRQDVLGIHECGTWRNRKYSHILPIHLKEKNILETIGSSFWDYAQKCSSGDKYMNDNLHRCFHHLNSSQAMCFNLFYPFLLKKEWLDDLARLLIGEHNDGVEMAEFEHIEDAEEGTNFDFFIRLKSGQRIFFECKFTEEEFGQAMDDERHQLKLKKIYRPMLQEKVIPEVLEPSVFFKNYQLLRNISHINPENRDHLFIIFPRGNSGIISPLDEKVKAIDQLLLEGMKQSVTVLYLEDLVENIKKSLISKDSQMSKHWRLFEGKYLPYLKYQLTDSAKSHRSKHHGRQ